MKNVHSLQVVKNGNLPAVIRCTGERPKSTDKFSLRPAPVTCPYCKKLIPTK